MVVKITSDQVVTRSQETHSREGDRSNIGAILADPEGAGQVFPHGKTILGDPARSWRRIPIQAATWELRPLPMLSRLLTCKMQASCGAQGRRGKVGDFGAW